ncbi:MAG TPA: hypothetical protein VFR42_13620 [Candidatus Acidoferrum sp.]|nr:hypothetical protein [Candidatus Acidoferrum sp.]
MVKRLLHITLLSLLIGAGVWAQQAGTVVGASPGSAKRVGGIKVERVVPPKPTCESAGLAMGTEAEGGLPEMEFWRQDLLCVRHSDGKTEAVRDGLPWGAGVVSAQGDVAYWIAEKSELHVFSPKTNVDTVMDTLPGANLRQMVWSLKGRTLVYFAVKADPAGIRVVNLDSGARNLISGNFVSVVASPDPEYLATVGWEGVQRVHVADGRREDVAKIELAADAAYSQGGKWLGVEATPASDPTLTANGPNQAASEDDSPDCTGGAFALTVFETATKRAVSVPFPKGFDTVLDFEFSPDERALAVTYGVTGCDYPGDAARVFVVSLADLKMTPISPENKLSVEAHWSPGGKKIVFLDYTGSDAGIVIADVKTGNVVRVTSPGQNGPDKWVAWR